MEFGSEVNEHASKPSDAPLPDLHIGSETHPKEKVKEPDVAREALPRLPEGVLNVTRPEPEARHRDPEHTEPERSAADATDAQEDRPREAAGSGGDVPPNDPPETAQAGEFDDGDNDRGDNGNGDRQDDILEGARAAAEASAKDAKHDTPEPTVAPQVNKPIPGQRGVPAQERTDAPVEEGALGTPSIEAEPTDADVRAAVDEFIDQARYGQQTDGDEGAATDTPSETEGQRKGPPSHFPSDREIREGIEKTGGLPAPDRTADPESGTTDGSDQETLADVRNILGEIDEAASVEVDRSDDLAEEIAPGTPETPEQRNPDAASGTGSETLDAALEARLRGVGDKVSDELKRVVDGIDPAKVDPQEFDKALDEFFKALGVPTASEGSDATTPEGTEPTGEGAVSGDGPEFDPDTERAIQTFTKALEHGLRPFNGEEAAKRPEDFDVVPDDEGSSPSSSPDNVGALSGDADQDLPPISQADKFMALNEVQGVDGPVVEPTDFNKRPGDTPEADGTEEPGSGPETPDDNGRNYLPSAQQSLDFIDEYRRQHPEETAPGTVLGERLNSMEASIYESFPHLRDVDDSTPPTDGKDTPPEDEDPNKAG